MFNVMIPSVLILVVLIASAIADKKRTQAGLKKSGAMLLKILPDILIIFSVVAIAMTFISKDTLQQLFGSNNSAWGAALAAGIGSIAIIPGMVAYPLAAALVQEGIQLKIIAVFITTLMMVGIITLPLEKEFFGWKVALLRNSLGIVGALLVGLSMGLFL